MFKQGLAKMSSAMRTVMIGVIRFYRYCISPLMAPHCRFEPTCSRYAQDALTEHGVLRGMMFSLRRLSRCHPWHEGGFDPVPETKKKIT